MTGSAAVTDADTLKIAGETIRLDAVDAPELSQSCLTSKGEQQRCGIVAKQALIEFIDGRTIVCRGEDVDAYGRWIARCYLERQEISTWLVSQGHALAYRLFSERLVAAENQARLAGRGIWQTKFQSPWDYRRERWQVASQTAPDGCPIKGNINRKGEKIYHTPWGSAHYNRTKISLAKGERWFCDEAEALAAGWRRAR